MPNHHKKQRERQRMEQKCCVCLETLNNSDSFTFPCGHRCIHNNCLSPEIQNCPLCRMVKDRYRELPPATAEQKIARDELVRLTSNIREPHCCICGDIDDLVRTKTDKNKTVIFCRFCFRCQEKLVASETAEQNLARLILL